MFTGHITPLLRYASESGFLAMSSCYSIISAAKLHNSFDTAKGFRLFFRNIFYGDRNIAVKVSLYWTSFKRIVSNG